ncbi:MAG: hypothetical protein KIT25_06290 [Enhydrobacter sp.]|nr:MAG: hypothetical protein KIT25_06290 [Enhydrobacter sp.]
MSAPTRFLIIVAAALVIGCPAGAAAPDATADGTTLRFAAFRNGSEIGSHVVNFEREGGRLKATTSIDLRVSLLGFTLYRYVHRAEEVWTPEGLLSLVTTTDDNGSRHEVRAARVDGALQVWHANAGTSPISLPATLVPTTHWNIRQVGQTALLNSQLGTLARVHVESLGEEAIPGPLGPIEATRYRYSGDIDKEQWFDRAGRWVRTRFVASDGSVIEYRLR